MLLALLGVQADGPAEAARDDRRVVVAQKFALQLCDEQLIAALRARRFSLLVSALSVPSDIRDG